MAESKLSKSEYQKKWRASHPRDKAEVNEYMKNYIANSESITCEICGGKYKTYSKYKHVKSQKHIAALDELSKAEKAKAEAEEARKQLEALAEAEAKRTAKPTPAPRKRKTPEPEPVKDKPVPAPRKKAEPTKAEALKMLEEYGSTDDEAEKPDDKPKLADLSVKLQGKTINADEVLTFIDKHFEESANPDRASSSKTPRRNKNSSLWKKVANELDGRKWSYLGENLGAIVARTYDKPSVQADFLQMLKMVVLHFTKTPKAVEETMKQAIFHLKQAHVSKQK